METAPRPALRFAPQALGEFVNCALQTLQDDRVARLERLGPKPCVWLFKIGQDRFEMTVADEFARRSGGDFRNKRLAKIFVRPDFVNRGGDAIDRLLPIPRPSSLIA